MKLETVKSIVLALLVGISLVLTLSLWNYQPNYDYLYDKPYVSEVDIGGTEVGKSDIVMPGAILFHIGDLHFGFSDPQKRDLLYRDMQSWVLYDFRSDSSRPVRNANPKVEVVFPEALPMEMLANLFTFNGEPELPQDTFQRIVIALDEEASVLEFHFLARDGEQAGYAVVNNSDKYAMLEDYVVTREDLRPYTVVNEEEDPFYIPDEATEMTRWSLTVTMADPNILKDALFANPSIVGRNLSEEGEVYYTDAQRGMRIYEDRRIMEFANPYEASMEPIEPVQLLDMSINNINGQKGWTNDFRLRDLDQARNRVSYQLFYNGYPIHSTNEEMTVMEQQWRQQNLYEYTRPLFGIDDQLGMERKTLPSGSDMIAYIQTQDTGYELENIRGMQIGYTLSFRESAPNVLTLDPAWFVYYNGQWQPLDDAINEPMPDRGGS